MLAERDKTTVRYYARPAITRLLADERFATLGSFATLGTNEYGRKSTEQNVADDQNSIARQPEDREQAPPPEA